MARDSIDVDSLLWAQFRKCWRGLHFSALSLLLQLFPNLQNRTAFTYTKCIMFVPLRYSGILSAYGLALADIVHEAQEPCAKTYEGTFVKHSIWLMTFM